MAGLGSLIPKLSAGSGSGFSPRDMPMQDKLLMLSAVLKGDTDAAMKIPLLAQARAQMAKQDAATQDLAQFASGKAVPQRADIMAAIDPQNATAPAPQGGAPLPGTMGLAPRLAVPDVKIPTRSPTADAMGGPVSVRSALPMLAKLAATGGDPSKWTTMLQAAQPKAMNVNGHVVDENDPGSIGGFYGDAPAKGAEPVYDSNRRQVGWRMADGAINAIEQAKEAEALGGTRGGMQQIPTRRGTTVPMLGSDYLDGRGRDRIDGLGESQSPAEKVAAEGHAKTGVERDANQPQAYAGLVDQGRASDLVRDTIHAILGDTKDPKTGAWSHGGSYPMVGGLGDIFNGHYTTGVGANLGLLNGTASHDLKAKLDTIRANTGFGELQKMRENSPTGGALGQVSEQENRLLQSLRGSLDQGQSADQLTAALREQITQLDKLAAQRTQLYQTQFAGHGPSGQTQPRSPTMAGKGFRILSVE